MKLSIDDVDTLLPPLAKTEYQALKMSIKAEGVREPIVVDENGIILDGRNRYQINKKAQKKVVSGLSEGEKLAFVFRANLARRNMSPEQKREVLGKLKVVAKTLKQEGRTQAQIGVLLGVAQQTVADWLDGHVTGAGKVSTIPDSRVKIPPKQYPQVAKRIEQKEPAAQVAADYGVSEKTVRRIATKERKQAQAKARREAAIKALPEDAPSVQAGDFRELAKDIPDASIDLILTDPPYDEASVSLYGDVAALGERVLKPGGWCLAYAGHSFLPDALNAMREYLSYGWTFAIIHSGGDLRFRKFKLQNKWKPLIGFYRPPLDVWWDWFPDISTGKREKTEHPWQQAVAEAEHFIGALTVKGGVVLDPMCGSGTIPLAARHLGRSWLAYEIDAEAALKATARISDDDTV